MELKLIALSETDGEAVYRMLQEMPAQENGFINPMHGKSYGEFRAWLQSCIADAAQEGLADGWKVPESTYWLFDGDRPVGYGKIRHFLTDKLLEDGGSIGYAVRPAERQRDTERPLCVCCSRNAPPSASRRSCLPSTRTICPPARSLWPTAAS